MPLHRTSTRRVLLLNRDRYSHVPMILPIKLCQMSDNRIVFSRRQVTTASWVPDSSFPADRRRDGCLRRVEPPIGDVGPSGRQMGARRGKELDMIHGDKYSCAVRSARVVLSCSRGVIFFAPSQEPRRCLVIDPRHVGVCIVCNPGK